MSCRPPANRELSQGALSWLTSSTETHLEELLEYCRHLQSSAYPSPQPQAVLKALELMIVHARDDFLYEVGKESESREETELWVAGQRSMKSLLGTFISHMSNHLARIRNARFAIAPPYSFPLLDLQVNRILKAFDDSIFSLLTRMEEESSGGSRALPMDDLFSRTDARSKQVTYQVAAVFSAVEPQETLLNSWPFELDVPRPLWYLPRRKAKGRRYGSPEVLWPIYFRYPLLDRNTVIALPLFYHEFAHLLMLVSKEVPRSDPWKSPSAAARAVARNVIARGKLRQLTKEEKRRVLLAWKEELLADRLAVRLVGPAFLVSLLEFAARGVDATPSPTHPRITLRLDAVLEEIKRIGHDEDDCAELSRVTKEVVRLPIAKSAGSAVMRSLEEVESSIRSWGASPMAREADQRLDVYLGEVSSAGCLPLYSADCFRASLAMADLTASHMVPPTAVYGPGMKERVDVVAVLNVPGVLLRGIGGEPPGINRVKQRMRTAATGTPDSQAHQAVCRLVHKALETVVIQETAHCRRNR